VHPELEAHVVGFPDIEWVGSSLDTMMTQIPKLIGKKLESMSPLPISFDSGVDKALNDFSSHSVTNYIFVVEVDILPYFGEPEKVNVTLPGHLINRIDKAVLDKPALYKNRSRFLAMAALELLKEN